MHASMILTSTALFAGTAIAAGPAFCSYHPALTSCLKADPTGTAFCQSYLSRPTSTVIVTRTRTPVTTYTFTEGTTTEYVATYTTLSSPTGTSVITASGQGTLMSTCSRTTLKPYTTTYTIPNGGPTIVYTFTGPNVKRDLAAATLAPSTPSCASGRPAATLSAACSCLSAADPIKTVTSITKAPPTTAYTTFTSPTYTYYYPATTTIYSTVITTTTTSYAATSTTYKLNHNGTYKAQGKTYNVYDNYRFSFDQTDVTFYSCQYGLCGLQPAPCKIKDCTNAVTDCLQVCPYVDGCTAVLYEANNINSNRTCAFINTRTNPVTCGYKDNLDEFGIQKGFGPGPVA